MASSYYITITRLPTGNFPATVTVTSNKKPVKLLRIMRKFFERRTWYTDQEMYKALGAMEQYKVLGVERVFHVNGLIGMEAGKVPVQETRKEPKLEAKLGRGEF